ncbi:MAG: cell division protein [uncultured bacterium]|nr:MAG: cell division protein [uncultured bacterium]OGT25882.1 MAG: cell division protein ZipA [Gammaproteobacteria bacterium RIFCSPHIGHO2_02_FULL_42_43]OGT28934.1 MAG: cell division protein ZipA [Gammaproteobacteria bacterium RIFCSPHIGHO2_01_FULL_42_8]
MLVVIALLSFVAVVGVAYLWKKSQEPAVNRYRKSKLFSEVSQAQDSDTSLGLQIPSPASVPPIQKPRVTKNNVVVALYLMAQEGNTFGGYELLQALLSAGLRFGDQRIFHRHAHKDGRGDILFHCASAVAPGTFDLTQMGSFQCSGLCLFFSANDVAEPLATLDCLLETIDQLVEDLGGQVLDDKRMTFTKEKMISYRQQLREVESSQITADLFD